MAVFELQAAALQAAWALEHHVTDEMHVCEEHVSQVEGKLQMAGHGCA